MPDVTLQVDGQSVTVPVGTNIVDAARKAETVVPVFCYHPKLKPVGMCRMCLVEVYIPKMDPATRQPVIGADGKPELALMMNKLQPGCVTPVSDGMVVKTTTERVKFAQKGQLEFLLTSHPLDCPVCDKGGECPLQNLTMQFGPGNSRFDYADKVHFQKPIPLGDLIYLDRERCILCSRCVRFQDDIAGDPVLGFDNRGRSWEIISKSEPAFDSKYSGNTTDICPVGALTSSDFRFKARVWELRSVPTVCNLCPVGCNLTLDMRHGELKRVMPRENDFVNEIWSCDKGRYGQRHIDATDRLTTPLVRRDGRLVPATWDEALRVVADGLAAAGTAVGGIAGTGLSNEALFLFQKLVRETLGSNNLDHRAGNALDVALDDYGAHYGVGTGTNLMNLGKGTAVLVIGADPEEEAPLYLLRLRSIAARGGDLTVVNPYATKLDAVASRTLHTRPGTEVALALALLRAASEGGAKGGELAARLRGTDTIAAAYAGMTVAELAQIAGVSDAVVRAAAAAFAAAEHAIIIYGQYALRVGTELTGALANLALLTGKVGRANSGLIALTPGGNSRGALDLGVRPDALPGGKALTQPGLSAREIWQQAGSSVQALLVLGSDPAQDDAQIAVAAQQLQLLVVADTFLTATAQLAHVVLPVAAFAESEGTTTNAERRVQRSRQAREHTAPAAYALVTRIAQTIGARVAAPVVAHGRGGALATAGDAWDYVTASDVADEIAATVPGYGGTAYTSLGLTRHSWGRQPGESVYYDGTSYENTEGVGVQIASRADDPKAFLPVARTARLAAPQAALLTLVPVVRAYDAGDWSRGSKLTPRQVPPHVVLSTADAQRIGVVLGEQVRVASSSGEVVLPVQIDATLAAGTVLVPLVRGAALAALAGGATTPVTVVKQEVNA